MREDELRVTSHKQQRHVLENMSDAVTVTVAPILAKVLASGQHLDLLLSQHIHGDRPEGDVFSLTGLPELPLLFLALMLEGMVIPLYKTTD